ncbi:MAG: C45 family autoproteolytic acyltransferase/hydrolase [Pirellula sp.]|nr:C45 family autoproteolytic acyltransferase/hydrolase [Pirellula sp.]
MSCYRIVASMVMACGVLLTGLVPATGGLHAQEGAAQSSNPKIRLLEPWLEAIQLADQDFEWRGELAVQIDGKSQTVPFLLRRYSNHAFDLTVEHSDYAATILRREGMTALILPKHRKVFWGKGATDPRDHLESSDLAKRIIRPTSAVAMPWDLVSKLDASSLIEVLQSTGMTKPLEDGNGWFIGDDVTLRFPNPDAQATEKLQSAITISSKEFSGAIHFSTDVVDPYLDGATAGESEWLQRHWSDFESHELDRAELERTIVRGARRALEVLAPSDRLKNPNAKDREVEHGRLRWIEGQRVAFLKGSPEEIGQAHAALLKTEAMRCIDSVLYGFGFAQTVATGRWFREDLDRAYEQLKPHIPERHLAETRALARGLELDERLVECLNVFPELFHCSGFAVFGDATENGKLFHGRVLDYMTTIGLQDAATTFVVAPDGQIPFVNVGYAGFTGSVTGMNAERISLGEMGGRGEGQWNGVPMATLMRRALEECDSLDEVIELWRDSPRTCEYFYVFADGEEKSAVGVAATPEAIEFVRPGQAHALLGNGIRDAVVLSAGSRLEELRARIQSGHGRLNAESSLRLMDRPVAMNSNLHNVLFVPEDGVLYVANASHTQPAAERPYVRIEFLELLKEIAGTGKEQAYSPAVTFTSKDSLCMEIEREGSEDARQCLTDLAWDLSPFQVTLEAVPDALRSQGCDAIVRFPSPIDTGDPVNDLVALEWYRAEKSGKEVTDLDCPAVVVVHESGKGMTVGRMIARGLSKQGVHALMMQLPSYGLRRGNTGTAQAGEDLIQSIKQGISDARRAYDAVRVLPGIDPNRIGLQGTSLGGFVVATVSGIDAAYHRSVILLAGGDLYSVLKNGDRDASKTREELAKRGITLESIRGILYGIEPLRLAHRVSPSKTWMFSGTHDTVVPPASSKAFVDAARLPDEQHVELPADHYSGIVFLPGVIRQIVDLVSEK